MPGGAAPPGATWQRAYLAGENAFAYGLLHERGTQEGERRQAQARRQLSRFRYRRWIGRARAAQWTLPYR